MKKPRSNQSLQKEFKLNLKKIICRLWGKNREWDKQKGSTRKQHGPNGFLLYHYNSVILYFQDTLEYMKVTSLGS